MKCNSCGSEWTVGTGASTTNKCPFCGAAMKNTASTDISYNEAFKKIVDLKGESVLNDRTLFLSMLSDIAPRLKDERDITEAALGKGVGKILLEKNSPVPARLKLTREKLAILSDNAANIFLDAVIYSFGWNDQSTSKSDKEQTQPKIKTENKQPDNAANTVFDDVIFSSAWNDQIPTRSKEEQKQPELKTENKQRSDDRNGSAAYSQTIPGSQPKSGSSYNTNNQQQSAAYHQSQKTAQPKPNNPYPMPSVVTVSPVTQKTYYQNLMERYHNGRAGEKIFIALFVFFRFFLAGIFAIVSLSMLFSDHIFTGVLMMLSAVMCSPFFLGKMKNKLPEGSQTIITVSLFLFSLIPLMVQ